MKRQELLLAVEEDIAGLLDLMRDKNERYGSCQDAFLNFRETARRTRSGNTGVDEMLEVLLTLADKHWIALCQCGIADPAAEERFGDIIVYSLIARQMIRLARQGWEP